MFRAIDPVASTTLQSYEHRQLLHRARRYIYIKGMINVVIVLLFLLTFPPELRPRMVAIALADAFFLVPYWFLVQRYPTLATCLSLCITALAISAGDWVGGYQTGASGILYALLIVGSHLVLITPPSTYLISGLITAIYVGTIALEVNGVIPIHFPFTFSNLSRVVSLNVISMLGLTILTGVVTRLYRELLQRNKELFALNAVSAAAGQSLHLDKVLQLALDRVLEMMELEGGGLYLLEASTGEMVLKAHRTLAEEFVGWVSRMEVRMEGFTDSPFRTGQVLVVGDLSQHPLASKIVGDGDGHRPLTIVPLKVEDRVLGMMNLLGRTGYSFTSQDVELLNAIGAQVGLAIENARLYEVEQDRRRITEALRETAGIIGSTLELNEVLYLILEQLRKVIDHNTSAIMMLEGDRLQVMAVAGFTDPEEVLQRSYTVKEAGLSWEVIRKKQALVVADVTKYPRWIYEAQSADVRAWIGAPLMANGEVIGLLTVDSYQVGKYSQDDAQLLMTFASKTALAIENTRLYQSERKRAAQLALVSQVARRAASILDMDQLLQEVVTAVQQSFSYHHVGLFLLDEVAGELKMQAIAGDFADEAPLDHRLALGEGMAGWTAQTGQPLLANDVSQEPRYVLGILKEALTKAELCVPLKLAGQVIGVLDIQCTQLNAFDETDLLAMETLADQMAVAIENARLFRETKRRFEEVTALYQTSLDITAQLEMTELLESIVKRAVTLLEAEGGSICLYDPEQEELRWVIGYGNTGECIGTALKPGEGMAGQVFQTGEPLIVDDYHTWEGRSPPYDTNLPLTAVLEVPLKWQERIIGVLGINADAQKRTFNQDNVWLATLFANQAAVAIENARIYEEERKRATQLELIGGITEKIASILDLDVLLHQVVHLIQDTFGYYRTSILLVEADSDELILRAVSSPFETLMGHLRLKIGQEGITGWVAHSGEPLLVNDVRCEPRYYPVKESKDTRSELAVPIKLKGESIGVLDVQSVELDAFSQDDASILQTLADQLAIAIENARLYQQTDEKLQTRVGELSALYAIAEVMTHPLDLEEVLQLVLDSAIRLTRMDSGGILLLDPSISELFLRAHRGGSPEFIRAVTHTKADEGLMPRMLKSVLVIDDLSEVTKDRRVAIEQEGFQSLVNIPLKARESVLGVMVMASRSPRTFAPQELELLAAIGNGVGVAVDRANLQAQQLRAAILEERQDMARQMHDDIAQRVSYLGLQVDNVMGSSSLAQNVEAQAELEEIRRVIEATYERVRSSIMRLEEDVPSHLDLRAALPEIISEFEKQSGCRVESKIDLSQLPCLSPSVAFQVAYIIREALTNVRKHSGADSVHLTLQSLEDDRVEVTIQDKGRGFDLDSEQQSGGRGFGLRFMRERAERIGGSLRIESQPGQGTRIVVSLPSG